MYMFRHWELSKRDKKKNHGYTDGQNHATFTCLYIIVYIISFVA